MRKIQAQPITHESWMLHEWGIRLGVLTHDSHSWHAILKDHKWLNQTLDDIQQHLNALIEFAQPDDSDESDSVQDEQGLPIKHHTAHNIEMSPRISYTRSVKGATRHAAGYWCIHFDTGWSGSLSPKCVTLDTYEHQGPFAHKLEMNTILNKLRKE